MIEDIKRLGAELRVHAFGDPRVFQQRRVKVVDLNAFRSTLSSNENQHRVLKVQSVMDDWFIPITVGLSTLFAF